MAVRIQFDIGHNAQLKKQPTPDGFTHDWELFVRGPDNVDISPFIEKVVFNLHESFPKPKRVVKEPPYIVKEAGYAGFVLPIDIYFKNNRDDPKKVQFNYDLDLQAHKLQKEEQIVANPSEEFRRRLMKGGGQIVSGYSSMQPPPRHSSGGGTEKPNTGGEKKHKQKLSVEDSKFHELFGPPITKSSKVSPDPIIKLQTKTSPNNISAGKLVASHRGSSSDSKKDKEKGDKDKSSKHNKHASPNKEKDKKSSSSNSENPKKDKSHSKERDKNKDKDRSSSSSSKRPGLPSPKRTLTAVAAPVVTAPVPLPPPVAIQAPTMVNSPKIHSNTIPPPSSKPEEKVKSSSEKKSSKKEKKYDKGEKERDKKDKEDKKKEKNIDKNATKEKTDSKSNKSEKELPAVLSAASVKDYAKDKKEIVVPTPLSPALTVPITTTTAVILPPPNKKDKSEKDKDKEERKHKHKKKDKAKDKDKDKDRTSSRDKKEKKEKEKTKDASPIIKPARLETKPIIQEPPAPPPQPIRHPVLVNQSAVALPQPSHKSHPLGALISEMSNGGSDSDDSEMDSSISIPPVITNDKHMDSDSSVSSAEVVNARPSSAASSNSRHSTLPPQPPIVPEKSHHNKNSKKEKKNDNKDEGKRRKRKTKDVEEPESYAQASAFRGPGRMPGYTPPPPRSPPSPLSPHSSSTGATMEPPAKLPKRDEYFNENSSSNNNNNKDESSSTATVSNNAAAELPSSEYMSELKDLQHKIMTLQDNNELQRVVEMIAATGLYEITSATFDFDLCALDRYTVKKLQEFFATSCT